MSAEKQDVACDACGVYLDIGSMIAEDDNVLALPIQAKDEAAALAFFGDYLTRAQARFGDSVTSETEWDAEKGEMKARLIFSCAAERIIFEMEQA
ncbi:MULTISPECIES: DUF406 family protein [Ferrimonas]|uniref:DUF406 family protein n=1 Tax=Ferrimonas TaxID=44011 RepID=UPI00047F421B|nr:MULTISPECIES: DUF406 family protein [Ferrimonas]USD39304.1 DUF406 family protein [Ferrimonas sp. SCSIO 43195]